jgi:hypothetical protein
LLDQKETKNQESPKVSEPLSRSETRPFSFLKQPLVVLSGEFPLETGLLVINPVLIELG